MQFPETEQIGIEGENYVARVVNQMGCRWTKTDSKHAGQDGYLEIYRRGRTTGLVLGVEIKSGRSYLARQKQPREFWIKVEADHMKHWLGHALPFILVWYDPESETAYWRYISHDLVAGNPIPIHSSRKFTRHVQGQLRRIAERNRGQLPSSRLPYLSQPVIQDPFRNQRPFVRVKLAKAEARLFYEEWRRQGCVSPTYGKVLLPRRAWCHLTAAHHAQRDIIRRLELLRVAKTVLESTLPHRRSRVAEHKRIRRIWYEQKVLVEEGFRADAVVVVVTERIGNGPVRFCTVYEQRSSI